MVLFLFSFGVDNSVVVATLHVIAVHCRPCHFLEANINIASTAMIATKPVIGILTMTYVNIIITIVMFSIIINFMNNVFIIFEINVLLTVITIANHLLLLLLLTTDPCYQPCRHFPQLRLSLLLCPPRFLMPFTPSCSAVFPTSEFLEQFRRFWRVHDVNPILKKERVHPTNKPTT